jgi:hypothetical protein
MKNFICLSVIVVGFLLVSCEKSADSPEESKKHASNLLENARQFSKQHDQLVKQMLLLDNELIRKRISSEGEYTNDWLLEHTLNIVYKVTGQKAEIVDPGSQKVSQASSGDNAGYFWITLDSELISLAPYAESNTGIQYLGKVDDIVGDTNLSLDEKLYNLELLSAEVVANPELDSAEMQRVLTSIEVLKGSLLLWSRVQAEVPSASPAQGLMKVSVKDWSTLKKLGFVAAADAVGGAIGFFIGGYLVINGVPVYLPAGPTGLAGMAAALSFIAAKMVGC